MTKKYSIIFVLLKFGEQNIEWRNFSDGTKSISPITENHDLVNVEEALIISAEHNVTFQYRLLWAAFKLSHRGHKRSQDYGCNYSRLRLMRFFVSSQSLDEARERVLSQTSVSQSACELKGKYVRPILDYCGKSRSYWKCQIN